MLCGTIRQRQPAKTQNLRRHACVQGGSFQNDLPRTVWHSLLQKVIGAVSGSSCQWTELNGVQVRIKKVHGLVKQPSQSKTSTGFNSKS